MSFQAPKVSRDNPLSWVMPNAYDGPATEEVQSRFLLAGTLAQDARDDTMEFLDRLYKISLDLDGILQYDWVNATIPAMDAVINPALEDVPEVPEFFAESPGPYSYSPPTLAEYPNAPSLVLPAFPNEPAWVVPEDPNLPVPNPGEIDFPESPVLVFPEQPVLHPIPLPSAPDIQILPWEGPDLPSSAGLDMPERQFEYDDIGDYVSGLLTQLRDKLLDTVINGGTGLHPDVEQALYDRAFLRLDAERLRRQQEAFNAIAGRGFNLPTGVLASSLTEVENEFSRQLREVNMDILVKQAELAQQNTHFAQTLSAQIEQAMLQDWQVKAARLFEIAKVTYDFFLQYYRSRAEIYNLRLEGYKAYAQAYESRLRAELTKIEVYKGQLEGARLNAEVQKLGVELYTTLMQSLAVRVDLYRTQMQAASIQLEVEKFKIDIYKVQYEAFATRVDAYKAQVQAFATRIGAVTEQIKGEVAKVDAYSTEVGAKAAQNEATIKGKALELEVHKMKISQYEAELTKYKVDYDAFLGRLDALMKKNGFELQRYATDADMANKKFSSEIQRYDADVRQSAAKATMDMERGKVAIENERLRLNWELDRLKHISSVLSQITASALGAVNASANIGFNASWNAGISNAFSQSYGDSRSDSGSTTYSRSEAKSA